MTIHSNKPCPCGSEISYEKCCEKYHKGQIPGNALDLMKSRYSAYVLNIPAYIIKTTHPASPHYVENKLAWKQAISEFSRETHFEKLEILDFKEHGSLAVVTFTVFYKAGDEESSFTERSLFEQVKGQWLYVRGQQSKGRDTNLILPGPLKILPLSYYGDPILKREGDLVPAIDDSIKQLVEEMIETMHVFAGMGIAAPQVHRSLKLFIAQPPIETPDGKYVSGNIEVYINPKISDPSDDVCSIDEGCLSIPTIRHKVIRPKEITIEYTNLQGETLFKRATGWEARVIQHEEDHVNGILFTDRLDPKEKAFLAKRLALLEERTR